MNCISVFLVVSNVSGMLNPTASDGSHVRHGKYLSLDVGLCSSAESLLLFVVKDRLQRLSLLAPEEELLLLRLMYHIKLEGEVTSFGKRLSSAFLDAFFV